MHKKKERDASSESLELTGAPKQVEAALADSAEASVPSVPPSAEVAPALPKPVEPSDLMPLRVYATIAGPKWDQMAGFVSFALRNKLGPCTMQQWREHFERFKNRTVR